MPKVNAKVMTPDGLAVVESNDMLKKIVTCKVFVDDTYIIKKFALEDITILKPQPQQPAKKDKKKEDRRGDRPPREKKERDETLEETEEDADDDLDSLPDEE